MDKLYIQFETVFWDDDVDWLNYVDDTDKILWPKTFNLFKFTGKPILEMFTYGESAVEFSNFTDEELLESGLAVIKKMYPAATNVVASYRTNWSKE